MKGSITRRGKHSWRIKFDVGTDPATGKRQTRYQTFKGTKKQAEVEAAKIIAGISVGTCVDGSKETVAQFAERWLRDWVDSNVSNSSYTRYEQVLRKHVSGRIGAVPIQKLNAATLQSLYAGIQRADWAPALRCTSTVLSTGCFAMPPSGA